MLDFLLSRQKGKCMKKLHPAVLHRSLRHKNQETPSKRINWRTILYRLLTGHILDGAARWVRLCTHDWQARLQGGTPNATQSWASQERTLLLAPSASLMERQGGNRDLISRVTNRKGMLSRFSARWKSHEVASKRRQMATASLQTPSLGSPPRRKRNSHFLQIYDKPWHSPIFKDLH